MKPVSPYNPVNRSFSTRVAARALVLAAAIALVPLSSFADDAAPPGAPPAPKTKEPAATTEATWVNDFDAALAIAIREKKNLLVDFTGSDWCVWCKRLQEEVFSQPEFVSAVPKDYVLVSLDFPHDAELIAKVPNAARNAELSKTYAVRGFPTVLLLAPDGAILAQTGYQEGGAAKYVEHLAAIRKAGDETNAKVAAIRAEFDGAKGEAKLAAAAKAADLIDAAKEGGPALNARSIVEAGVAADPDNAGGFKARGLKLLLLMKPDAARIAEALAFDPKNENGVQEIALLAKLHSLKDDAGAALFVVDAKAFAEHGVLKDPAVYVNLLGATMNIYIRKLGDPASAKAIAKILKEKGPQDNPKLTKFLDGVLTAEDPPK